MTARYRALGQAWAERDALAAKLARVEALLDTEMDTGNSYAADGWVAAMDTVRDALAEPEETP